MREIKREKMLLLMMSPLLFLLVAKGQNLETANQTCLDNSCAIALPLEVHAIMFVSTFNFDGFSSAQLHYALAVLDGVMDNAQCALMCSSKVSCVGFRIFTYNKNCVLYKAGYEPIRFEYFKKS